MKSKRDSRTFYFLLLLQPLWTPCGKRDVRRKRFKDVGCGASVVFCFLHQFVLLVYILVFKKPYGLVFLTISVQCDILISVVLLTFFGGILFHFTKSFKLLAFCLNFSYNFMLPSRLTFYFCNLRGHLELLN